MAKVFFTIMSLLLVMSVWASFTGAGLADPQVNKSIRGGSTRNGRTHMYYRGK